MDNHHPVPELQVHGIMQNILFRVWCFSSSQGVCESHPHCGQLESAHSHCCIVFHCVPTILLLMVILEASSLYYAKRNSFHASLQGSMIKKAGTSVEKLFTFTEKHGHGLRLHPKLRLQHWHISENHFPTGFNGGRVFLVQTKMIRAYKLGSDTLFIKFTDQAIAKLAPKSKSKDSLN